MSDWRRDTPDEEPPPDGDPLLRAFIKVVERGVPGVRGLGIGVTVVVSGRILSGRLIGTADWLQGIGKQPVSNDPLSKAVMEVLGTALAERGSTLKADILERVQHSGTDAMAEPTYAHLSNVSVLDGQVRSIPGMLLRIRIERIDSWSMGELSG